eukprot:6209608-Pleurochrysis_carterae.AAC.4
MHAAARRAAHPEPQADLVLLVHGDARLGKDALRELVVRHQRLAALLLTTRVESRRARARMRMCARAWARGVSCMRLKRRAA